jgi:hypothetical protein
MKPAEQQPPPILLNLDMRIPIRRTGSCKKLLTRRHILFETPNTIPIHTPIIIIFESPKTEIPSGGITYLPLYMIITSQSSIDINLPPSIRTENHSSSGIRVKAGGVGVRRKTSGVVITSPHVKSLEIECGWRCGREYPGDCPVNRTSPEYKWPGP